MILNDKQIFELCDCNYVSGDPNYKIIYPFYGHKVTRHDEGSKYDLSICED